MAEKNSGEVEQKIDEIAKELKDLLAKQESENSSAAKETPAAKKPAAKSKSTAAKKPASKSTAAKKPAAKTTAAKKPAAKSTTAKSTSKSTAAKKPAAKKANDAPQEPEEVRNERVMDDEVAKAIAEAQAFAAQEAAEKETAPVEEHAEEQKAEAPVEEHVEEQKVTAPIEEHAEEPKATAPVDEHAEEQKAEEPVEEQKAEEPEKEAAATENEAKPAKRGGAAAIAAKTDRALKKAKLPIFIVINSLFLVSAILLMFASYADDPNGTVNVFWYFANADKVKAFLMSQATGWYNGAYVMLGLLMFFAMLVPLALVVKNLIIFIRKKDASVYKADALIYFAAMLFFIGMVNFFGAWISAGQLISLLISAFIIAFTLLTLMLTKSVKQLPFFSICNIVLAFVAVLTLTSYVYSYGESSWYGAAASSEMAAGGLFFLLMLIAIAALVLLIIMQIKRIPGAIGHIVEIVVPLAAAGCALIALIVAGASKPDGLSMGGGYIFGVILTILIAIADTLFTFLKPLKKYKVMVDDSDDGNGNNVFSDGVVPKKTEKAEETPVAEPKEEVSEEQKTEAPEEAHAEERKPADEPKEEAQKVDGIYCSKCGTQNEADSLFCYKCGNKLK